MSNWTIQNCKKSSKIIPLGPVFGPLLNQGRTAAGAGLGFAPRNANEFAVHLQEGLGQQALRFTWGFSKGQWNETWVCRVMGVCYKLFFTKNGGTSNFNMRYKLLYDQYCRCTEIILSTWQFCRSANCRKLGMPCQTLSRITTLLYNVERDRFV